MATCSQMLTSRREPSDPDTGQSTARGSKIVLYEVWVHVLTPYCASVNVCHGEVLIERQASHTAHIDGDAAIDVRCSGEILVTSAADGELRS